MKNNSFICSMILLSGLLLISGCQDNSNDLAEVNKTIEAFDNAWNELNFEGALGFYSENAISFSPNQEVRTWPEIKANYEKMASGEDTLHNGITEINRNRLDVKLEGTLAYEIVSQSTLIKLEGQEPISSFGKYIHIWEKQENGRWKIIFDMYNSSEPTLK